MQNQNNHNDNQGRPALVFLPDISGFTKFINNTEVMHSKHIIEELLELLIDANDIGLEVSEIEGDAILFYRFGIAPTAAELLAQVQKMFVRFHAHLKKYDTHRICQCGACKSANKLTLKFIAHYGVITTNKVKDHFKLFGKEVIVAHRLMKNQVRGDEYAIFTNSLINACSTWVELPTAAWAEVNHGEERYDSGPVDYCHLSLAPLMAHVPEPTMEDYSIAGATSKFMDVEAVIEAPAELTFAVIADLPWRSAWISGGLPKVDSLNHTLNQIGATHRCLASSPVIYTSDFQYENDLIRFTEIDEKKTVCVVYSLRKLGAALTKMEVNAFLKNNIFLKVFFSLFMKKKFLRTYHESLVNLNTYCRDLYQNGREHPSGLVVEKPI